jgi:hypothetical protein
MYDSRPHTVLITQYTTEKDATRSDRILPPTTPVLLMNMGGSAHARTMSDKHRAVLYAHGPEAVGVQRSDSDWASGQTLAEALINRAGEHTKHCRAMFIREPRGRKQHKAPVSWLIWGAKGAQGLSSHESGGGNSTCTPGLPF